MSNKHLNRYQELYSKYIDHAVELHNYHLSFIMYTGYDTSLGVRKHLRAMRELEKEMIQTCRKAYTEQKNQKIEERREILRKRREERAWRLANPRPRGRPKGNISNGKFNRSNDGRISGLPTGK
jgi:IS30 family transposase